MNINTKLGKDALVRITKTAMGVPEGTIIKVTDPAPKGANGLPLGMGTVVSLPYAKGLLKVGDTSYFAIEYAELADRKSRAESLKKENEKIKERIESLKDLDKAVTDHVSDDEEFAEEVLTSLDALTTRASRKKYLLGILKDGITLPENE